LKVVKHPDSETHLVPSPVVGEARAIEPAVASDGSRDRALLVAATQRARQVFQASPCGAVLIGLDAVIVEANQAFEVLMGRSDFVGKHLSQVVDVAESGAIASHLDGLLRADGDRMVAQWATRTRSGTTYLSVSSLLLRAVDGAPEQVLLSCIDDSARHQHEAQLAFVSNHDMLTGLTNRHSSSRRCGRRWTSAGATAPTARCSWSASTRSRRSTTPSGTPQATHCSSTWPRC
jgi:PAS domain S-box-containing protein